MKEFYKVGVYIEDEFTTFATCTNINGAKKAKKLLEDAGWGEECDECEYCEDCGNQDSEEYEIEYEATPHCGVVILKSNLYLDSITIDDTTYDLTESDELFEDDCKKYEKAMETICDECQKRHNIHPSYCDEQCMVRTVWYNMLDETENKDIEEND